MKKKIQQKLASKKRKIERRLEEALKQDGKSPVFTASNIHYELSGRSRAITHGGIGAIHLLAQKVGLVRLIDTRVEVLEVHRPYHESDHVLNIAYNILCGGRVLEDIEVRRNDEVFLDAMGTESIPDPTTAGDFCRRFGARELKSLMGAINGARLSVWRGQPSAFTEQTARLDADGSLVPTTGECKEGLPVVGRWREKHVAANGISYLPRSLRRLPRARERWGRDRDLSLHVPVRRGRRVTVPFETFEPGKSLLYSSLLCLAQ